MSGICEFCETSDNFEKDENLTICTSCGLIVEEEIFENDEGVKEYIATNSNDFCNLEEHSKLMKRELMSKSIQTESRRDAKRMLNHCMSTFKFSDIMKKQANQLFIQLINDEKFYRGRLKIKIILAGISAYLTMIKFNNVITKNAISKVIGCSVFEFGAIYKRVIKQMNLNESKFFTIDQHISSTINSLQIDQTEIPRIESIVTKLINFQRDCCLIDSNFSVNLILANSFLAWKFIKIHERSKVNLNQFMDQFNIKCNLQKYYTKSAQFLVDLCKFIPWISNKKKVNKKTIYYFIQDLFDHSNTIIANYMESKAKKINEQIVKQDIQLIESRFKREYDEIDKSIDQQDNDEKISLSNISDSEIDCYIRSEKEVQILKKIRKNLIET